MVLEIQYYCQLVEEMVLSPLIEDHAQTLFESRHEKTCL